MNGSLTPTKMFGAVGIVDVLGWKGIWKRHEPLVVFEAIRKLQDQAVGGVETSQWTQEWLKERQLSRLPPLEFRAAFYSDSLIVCAGTPAESLTQGRSDDLSGFEGAQNVGREAIDILGVQLAKIQTAAARTYPPLALRGAASVGHYWATKTSFVGEAIDHAGQGEKRPEAALIWLASDAGNHTSPTGQAWFDYEVPLKGPPVRRCGIMGCRQVHTRAFVVNPLAFIPPDEFPRLTSELLNPLTGSGSDDVERKLVNTRRFLDAAAALRKT